jgi:uncharacterized glyoxalase superfamily protein PhnB
MPLRPALTFAGNAESAIAHYRAALGGTPEIIRFAGSPAENDVPAHGAVLMPFEKTFFAQKFGMTTDKFGVRWMVSVRPGMN